MNEFVFTHGWLDKIMLVSLVLGTLVFLVGVFAICIAGGFNKKIIQTTIAGVALLFLGASIGVINGYVQKIAFVQMVGKPITIQAQNIEGRIFSPQAFVVTKEHIIVYDGDGKMYTLDGIRLEDGLKPETLAVGSNIAYTVYAKAGLLFFGRVEPPML